MTDDETLGARLRKKRRESGLTQEELAAASGVSQVMIAKVEQGRRIPRMPLLFQLARALDIPLSELIDNRPRLDGRSHGASILAMRDALLPPSLLPGMNPGIEDREPAPAAELRATLTEAARLYWTGQFSELAAILPPLITEARLSSEAEGMPGCSLLAQVYDLAASLMVHMGKEDLAAIGAERAITAAAASGDELLHAMMHGTYAWVLLHQGRLAEAEQLAVRVADNIEPSFSAPDHHVAVWGSLLMTALAPAAASGRDVSGYVTLASAGGERLGRKVSIYNTSFASSLVHMQACHAYAVMREPGKAIAAARKIDSGELFGISYGRHLLDVAQAHTDARHSRAAVAVLTKARAIAPVWFRHQGIARSLVNDLYEQEKRVSPALRDLGASVDPDWYAPYYRR